MKVTRTPLEGLLHLAPPVFPDDRGFFQETFSVRRYAEAGIDVEFVQDNHSRSSKGVLRGLHYQLRAPQAKLVWVARGEVLDVAVDIRRGSPTFGKSYATTLTASGGEQLFLPAGMAHGFLVLSDVADFCYKCSAYYSGGDDQLSILWSDPTLALDWGGLAPLLSEKDATAPLLKDVEEDRLPLFKG